VTLVYRSVWSDQSADAVALLDEHFARWVSSKGIDPSNLPRRGQWQSTTQLIDIRRGDAEAGAISRLSLIEHDPEGRTWTTTATAIQERGSNAFWVDLDCANPRFVGFSLAAPRLVRDLLNGGSHPTTGRTPLYAAPFVPRPETAEALTATLVDPERTVPIAVFSTDQNLEPKANMARAAAAAETLAGLAAVWMASPRTLTALNAQLHDGFRVWGGAVRLYLPGLDMDDPDDAARHRWFAPRMFDRHPRRAGQLLGQRLLRSSIDTAPPQAWERFRLLIARPGDDELANRVAAIRDRSLTGTDTGIEALQAHNSELIELLALAEAERDAQQELADKEIRELRDRLRVLEEEHLDDVIQLEEIDNELQAVRRSFQAIASSGNGATGDGSDPIDETPPLTPSDAAERARSQLHRLCIPEAALRDTHRLDESNKCSVWASHTWQAFRALHDYAADVASGSFTDGGFYQWCSDTGRWPTTKLSMTESQTVMSNARLAACRMLPVSKNVHASGHVAMQAHLKIQPGGGPTIPRLYFHDDTKGATGQVHVGFFGPHDLMPNTKTN